jgi:hypothetical protein
MAVTLLYHGANGDAILGIIESRTIKPNQGQIFFSAVRIHSRFRHQCLSISQRPAPPPEPARSLAWIRPLLQLGGLRL